LHAIALRVHACLAESHAIAAKGLGFVTTAPKQLEMGGFESPADEEAEIEAGYVWREQLWSALRSFVNGYIANGQKGYDAVAAALDKRWGPKGRSVSASKLRAALHDSERNNFRAEWLDWFAARDREVADLIARRVKPAKTAEDRIADLEAEVREALSHKLAEQVIRKARAR
jgi:hypothetical protein